MSVSLEGGCRVSNMREGGPVVNGTVRVWSQVGRHTGAQAISLRILEFAQGLSPGLRNESCDEILYVLEGGDEPGTVEREGEDVSRRGAETQRAKILIDGWPFDIASQTGIYLRPGQTLTVDNPHSEPLVLISSQCPDPQTSSPEMAGAITAPLSQTPPPPAVVRLADRAAQPTADRWYRVLVDDEVGSTQVTQFVGSIPPGRAPDHFHHYEEVLFILRGTGRLWAGLTNTPIAAGSCVYLPKGQVHCVENTGGDELRLLGIFYPAGSPSVRYDV
jgi:mannose-6-phosphate isomerase-like protein (cupin superfamily)